jgi:hypothetical protein
MSLTEYERGGVNLMNADARLRVSCGDDFHVPPYEIGVLLFRHVWAEFKAETVELIRSLGRSVGDVCRDLGLTERVVRRLMQRADSTPGSVPS